MYKLSKYCRVFDDIERDNVIYNSVNKGIVSMHKDRFIEGRTLSGLVTEAEIDYLKQNNFLEGELDLEYIRNRYERFDTLIISLELFLHCNLSCPYCYQIGNTTRQTITHESLDCLFEYIKNVYIKEGYKTLIFKVLGGEPTVNWKPAEYIINKLFDFCEENGVYFKLMIDTNGTIIKDILCLDHYHSLTLTIPLTEKECHNRYRKYLTGQGTYDDIISNVNIISKAMRNVNIVLRYNIDGDNIMGFEKYVKDLKAKLNFTPIVSPNYTMSMGGGDFQNSLSHQELVDWRSSFFIDTLVTCDFPIVVTPYSISGKCQYWSRYSLKMFSDGTVGACAMSFWDKGRPKISDVCKDIRLVEGLSNGAKFFSPFEDVRCKLCDSLFLCGGTYNLPCSKTLGERKCEHPDSLHINLKMFLSRYIKYSNEGKGNLFVGFNDDNIYR